MPIPTETIGTIVAVAALAALTFLLVRLLGLDRPWLQPWAILRAAVQLGLLALVLRGVITSFSLTGLLLAVMVFAASITVRGRLRLPGARLPFVIGVLAIAAALPSVLVFALGAAPLQPRYLVAVVGILVGNAMTVTTLMGRGLATTMHLRRDEVEAWLALGATPRRAALPIVRHAASTAVLPSTDQTRTTGIVTLPGAFVGAIFGGASPLAAAEFQLVVLAGVLAAGAVVTTLTALAWGAPATVSDAPPRLG